MILEGTTSSGAVVPVQVTDDGKVVAEGQAGPQGPEGPEGPAGPAGSPGNLWSGSDPGPISYDGGSVGIGLTSPQTSLHVAAADPALRVQDSDGTDLYAELSHSDGTSVFLSRSNANYGRISFRQFNGTTTETPLAIDSQQRVGIGTAAPSARLEIQGESTGSLELARLRIQGQTNNPMLRLFADEANQTVSIDTSGSVSGTDLVFKEGGAERVRLDSSGRFLVGLDTAPAGTVAGDVVCQGAVVLKSPDGAWWAVEVANDGTLFASATAIR